MKCAAKNLSALGKYQKTENSFGASRIHDASLPHEPKVGENQAKILHYLERNPSSHLRRMKVDLGLALGTLRYHLHSLEKQGRIASERHDSFRYFFLVSKYSDYERRVLKALYHENTRRILMFIMERKTPTLKDIVNNIRISYAAARWHLDRLVDLEMILELRDGKFRRYQISTKIDVVVGFLKEFYSNEWGTWTNKIVNNFLSISNEA